MVSYRLLIALAGLGLQASVVRAAESPPAATQPAKGDLDPIYTDGSFGFSVRPPAGCSLFREKQAADDGIEVARFVSLEYQWSFNVRLSKTSGRLDAQTILKGIHSNLTQYQDLAVLREEEGRIAARDGVRFAASFKAEGQDWLRQQAVVGLDAKEYFGLVFVTPLADRGVAEPLFEKIVGSFQILRDERARERLQAALDRGMALLDKAAKGEIDITSRVQDQSYLRCLLDGKEIGFIETTERAGTLDNRKGMQLREWGWLFNPDGSVTHMQHDMFLSSDLSHERWENRLLVLPAPTKSDAARQLLVDLENAARTDDQLGVAYLPRPNAREKRDKVITVEKAYASAAWSVLFPRVVDLRKPELYAFSTYKSDRRGLVLRTLEVTGESRVLIDGRQVPAFKLEDSEGLIPPKTELYVDRNGQLLRAVAGPLDMVATTRQYVEQKYGAKVREATELFRKLDAEQHPAAAMSKPPAAGGAPGRGDRSAAGADRRGRAGEGGIRRQGETGARR